MWTGLVKCPELRSPPSKMLDPPKRRRCGGVSELLRSSVPLLNDLGLIAHWQVIGGEEAFFQATKKLHNALQGERNPLTVNERDVYLETTWRNVEALADQRYDVVFANDPQPAAMLSLRGRD